MFSSVYFCWLLWSSILFTLSKKYYHSTEACHVLYNVQLYDKYENEWKDLCCNTEHLFIGQADLCLDIWHNIVWHISSAVRHDLTVDTYTFLSLPYQMLWRTHDAHVEWLYLYIDIIYLTDAVIILVFRYPSNWLTIIGYLILTITYFDNRFTNWSIIWLLIWTVSRHMLYNDN